MGNALTIRRQPVGSEDPLELDLSWSLLRKHLGVLQTPYLSIVDSTTTSITLSANTKYVMIPFASNVALNPAFQSAIDYTAQYWNMASVIIDTGSSIIQKMASIITSKNILITRYKEPPFVYETINVDFVYGVTSTEKLRYERRSLSQGTFNYTYGTLLAHVATTDTNVFNVGRAIKDPAGSGKAVIYTNMDA